MIRKQRPMMTFVQLAVFFLLVLPSQSADTDANWAQFRGPGSRGVADGNNLPDRWSATENVEWKTDIPGRGWSSPIVWQDKVFLTTVINKGKLEKPKKGLYFGGNRPAPKSIHQWQVLCLSLKSGKVLWQKQVKESKPESAIHLKGSFAAETPVTDGERLYVYFGNVGLFCFDLDGNRLWTKPLQVHKTRFGWGTASSPVLHKDRLYLVNDNDEDSYLLALDKLTGDEIWRTARKEKSNWATPYIWQNDLRTEIVTPGTGKIRSYDLDGKLLWTLSGMSSITIATPYEYNGLLYVSSGYVGSIAKPIYAIRPGAKRDISLKKNQTSNEWIAWCQRTAAPYNPSTLAYKDRIYILKDRGFVACYNPRDGKMIYERRRIPAGGGFTSSPWAYDDKIFCLNEDGVTIVAQAGDEFEILNRNRLAEDDMCMATPAIAGNRLLIRTSARVYCIANPSDSR